MPPNKQDTPSATTARSTPITLWPRPLHPSAITADRIPTIRNGNTNEFGIRRLRRSVTVAARTSAVTGQTAIGLMKCMSIGRTHEQQCTFLAVLNDKPVEL